jgi:hypothetical protein
MFHHWLWRDVMLALLLSAVCWFALYGALHLVGILS